MVFSSIAYARLSHAEWPYHHQGVDRPFPRPYRKFSTLPIWTNHPLIDDFPKIYYREQVGSIDNQQYSGHQFATTFTGQTWDLPSAAMSFFDHTERILALRQACKKVEDMRFQPYFAPPEPDIVIKETFQTAHTRLWDPAKFSLPPLMTEPVPNSRTHHYPVFVPVIPREILYAETIDSYIFNTRNSMRRNRNAPVPNMPFFPGFWSAAYHMGTHHWQLGGGAPRIGEGIHGVWTRTAMTTQQYKTATEMHCSQPYTNDMLLRAEQLARLNSYPPKTLPTRLAGEEMIFAGPLHNDTNQVCGVEEPMPILRGRCRPIPDTPKLVKPKGAKRRAAEMDDEEAPPDAERRNGPRADWSDNDDEDADSSSQNIEEDSDYNPSEKSSSDAEMGEGSYPEDKCGNHTPKATHNDPEPVVKGEMSPADLHLTFFDWEEPISPSQVAAVLQDSSMAAGGKTPSKGKDGQILPPMYQVKSGLSLSKFSSEEERLYIEKMHAEGKYWYSEKELNEIFENERKRREAEEDEKRKEDRKKYEESLKEW
jgi:hypothetical protein